MAKEKVEKQEDKAVSPNEQMEAHLQENKTDHYNFGERIDWRVSTGSFLLDSATKLIRPSLIRLVGNNNEGKTPEMLEIARNFLTTIPNSRGVFVLAEGRLSEENRERCGLKFVTKTSEWEDGTMFVLESNVFEFFINTVKNLVLNNPLNKRYVFCIDSLDGLILREDSKKNAEESHKVAGPQLLTKKMMQSLSLGMFKFGHLMLMTSQVTAEVKLDPYAKTPNRGGMFSGGNAVLHAADWIFEFQPSYQSDFILDNPKGKINDGKTKVIGKWCKVLINKACVESAKKQLITYPIKYGRKPCGIWLEYELGDLLVMWGLATLKGAGWITIEQSLIKELSDKGLVMDEKYQGMDNFREFLENNPKITEFLVGKFKKLIIH